MCVCVRVCVCVLNVRQSYDENNIASMMLFANAM